MLRRLLHGALSAMLLVSPRTVQAGNDDELLLGNRAAMIGGAVVATVDDSSATWYNPAGLAAAPRDQIDISATVYTLRTYSVPAIISTPSGARDDGSVTEFVVVPAQIAFVRRLSSDLSLGFGYFSPHAEAYVLREALTDPLGMPASQWQIAGAGTANQHVFAAALGRAFTPRLRMGVSLLGGYVTGTSSVYLFGALGDGSGVAEAASTASALATSSTFSLQLGLGMQLDITPQLTLGVALRSPELQLYYSYASFQIVSLATVQDPDDPRLGALSDTSSESVTFELLRSGRGALSLAYRYARGFVTLEVDAQPPLHRPKVNVDRDFVVNARLGLYHTLTPAISVGAGLFTDRTAATSNDFIDGTGDFYGGTLGVELSNEHMLAPSERASSLIFKTVVALRYAYCHGDFGTILADPEFSTGLPFVNAKGSITIHELSLYLGGGLHF